MNPEADYSSESAEHYTPEAYLAAAREVLGAIDLDPASCVLASERVGASAFYALPLDGLELPWFGRVVCNPPGGTRTKNHPHFKTRSNMTAWWRKLSDEYTAGRVTEAIFVGFNLEILRKGQGGAWLSPMSCAICIPEKRIRYLGTDGKPQTQPPKASVIVYLGRRPSAFQAAFSKFGQTVLF